MRQQLQAAVMQHYLQGIHNEPFLRIKVRRTHLILDATVQLSREPLELKKPLRVEFTGVRRGLPSSAGSLSRDGSRGCPA
jgi:hypothetical protein